MWLATGSPNKNDVWHEDMYQFLQVASFPHTHAGHIGEQEKHTLFQPFALTPPIALAPLEPIQSQIFHRTQDRRRVCAGLRSWYTSYCWWFRYLPSPLRYNYIYICMYCISTGAGCVPSISMVFSMFCIIFSCACFPFRACFQHPLTPQQSPPGLLHLEKGVPTIYKFICHCCRLGDRSNL